MAVDSASFVNGALSDYHLVSDSPAVDAGIDFSDVVSIERDGVNRPKKTGFDIGAYLK